MLNSLTRVITVFLVSLFLLSFTNSIKAGIFRYESHGFSISLPSGWIEIPSSVIRDYVQEVRQILPNATIPDFDYAFQLQSGDKWLSYPYILIQTKKTGRIPEHELTNLDINSFSKEVQESVDTFPSIYNNMLKGVKTEVPYYNSELHILWIKGKGDVTNIGTVAILQGMVLTEEGFILVSCVCNEEDIENYSPVFQDIIRSLNLSENIKYRARFTDKSSILSNISWVLKNNNFDKVFWKAIGKATVLGILFGIVSIVVYLFRRKKSPKMDLKQCPSCHAFQDATKKECPNCGCELTNIKHHN